MVSVSNWVPGKVWLVFQIGSGGVMVGVSKWVRVREIICIK
jgi:hypothetical protein